MEVIGNEVLARAGRRFAQARPWLEGWLAAVEDAEWKHLQDVRVRFPHADGVKAKSGVIVTVFNVGGNDFRLLTTIIYPTQMLVVHDVLTHAEYDKKLWIKRL